MKRYIAIYFILFFTAISCESYLDINENPNGAIEPPLEGLLSNTTYNTAINIYNMGHTTSYYTQYTASSSQGSLTDTQRRISTGNIWTGIYDISSDVSDLIAFGMEQDAIHYVGVGKILMAINMGMAVDVYGDLPYEEAFNFETITPSYDDDEAVYTAILSLIDQAITDLHAENVGIPLSEDSDFIYQGDTGAWIKAAYALKARYLNHLSKTSQYDPVAVLDAVSKAYTSNDDDAELTDFRDENPWYRVARNNENNLLDGWLSEYFVDALNGTTFGVFDPRLPLITSPLADGSYRGTRNGKGRIGDGTTKEEVYLTTDGFYSQMNAPLLVLTFSELKFIEAEAQLRNGNPTGAYAAYLDGIRANMEKIGVDSGDIDDYLNESTVAVGANNLTLKTIFKEKYVAMFLQPESWVDARRNDYNYKDMEIPVNHNPDLGGEFIRRIDYPDSERQRNDGNIPNVDLLTRIWWDAD